MSSKLVVLITGANKGLGYETIRALMGSEVAHTIILGGRSLDNANAAVASAQAEHPNSPSQLEAIKVDVESDESISACVAAVSARHGRVDVLVNNAGAQFDPKAAAGDWSLREAWNKSWDVNVTGAFVMTHETVPLLLKAAQPRLIFITSGLSPLSGSMRPDLPWNKPPPGGWPKASLGLSSYRSTKTGMNMMFVEWTRILGEDGVKTFCISPGYLATNLGGSKEHNEKMGAIDPTIGGNFVKDVIEGKRDADAGKIITRDGVQAY